MPVRRSSARGRRARSAVGLDWPGRGEGLSDRESEILALVTRGKRNAQVAALTYLSPNTVKSYSRIYRKIEVGSRTQAVLWASTMDSPQTSTGSIIGEVVPEQAVIFSPFRVKTATPSSSTTMRPRLVD